MKDFKNSTKTVSGHSFPSQFGFTGSSGKVHTVSPYTRKAPIRKASGGSVEDNACVMRDQPTNQLDAEYGGKSPLRPGFKKGGKAKAVKKAVGGYARGGKKKYAEGGKSYGKGFNSKPMISSKC